MTNSISGSTPNCIGQMTLTSLEQVGLGSNDVSGELPDYICNLTRLEVFEAIRNRITGHIPSCIGNLTSLKEFLLLHNRMTDWFHPSRHVRAD